MSSFACQFQEVRLDQLAASPFDMLVLDYSRDGHAQGAYSREELQSLRRPGRKLVAYLSVGEAESYRYYWQPSWSPGQPPWLGPTNPQWGGNYKVHYWDPKWRTLVYEYADKIVAQGFDGLFLDVVDAYEFWQEKRPLAPADMAQLVVGLAGHTRQKSGPEFGIFLNGGQGLMGQSGLLECITGVAKEEIFFGLDGDGNATPKNLQSTWKKELEPLVKAGKLILSIDYTNNPRQMQEAHQKAAQAGYLEYIGVRNLDRLVKQPTPRPPG